MTVRMLGGVGWFFGRDVQQRRGYPIGLVSSTWGGTNIETWISPTGLAACKGEKGSKNDKGGTGGKKGASSPKGGKGGQPARTDQPSRRDISCFVCYCHC